MKKCGWLAQETARQTRHCGKLMSRVAVHSLVAIVELVLSPTPAPVATPSKGGKGKRAYAPSPSKGGKGKRVLRGAVVFHESRR